MEIGQNYKYPEHTLASEIACSGVCLHCGKNVNMKLIPSNPGTGIVFVRTDIKDKNNIIPATYLNVVDARLCTCIGNAEGVTVGMIEHFMAALHAFGITNLRVELDAPEVPLMDGSAQDFITLIECVGVVAQNAPQKAIRILKKVNVEEGEAKVELAPGETGLKISFSIDFPQSTIIGKQNYSLDLKLEKFKELVGRARTFGFVSEVEQLRAMGLAKGASLENVIAVQKDGVMNPEGLRDKNEFVAHKILDSVGDLFQINMPVLGNFKGEKSGHRHVNQLWRKLMADHDAYEIVSLDEVLK